MRDFWKAAVKLMRGIVRIHPVWALFVQLLIFLHAVAPWFFLGRVEAIVALVSFALSSLTMVWLTGRFGFSRILGLAHFWWLPIVVFFVGRLGETAPTDPFGLWLWAIVGSDLLSLILDGVDVARWLKGERGEMVAGL